MAVDLLKRFHDTKDMSKAVQDSLLKYCQDLAGQKALQGQDVSGFKDAAETIQRFFVALNLTYGEKTKPSKDPE